MIEIGTRERLQPAPPSVVWGSLVDPHRDGTRPWLELLDEEQEPTVMKAVEPALVIWTSLWPDRPDDVVRFDLRPSRADTALRWTIESPGEAPDQSRTGFLRYRMNLLINQKLRLSYGQ